MEAYAKAHPRMRAAIWRKHAYGLTEAAWFALYEAHKGRCAICKKAEPINRLNVDHNHRTGQVRGMLCGHCNKALGHFFDRLQLLWAAQRYLERERDFLMPKAKPDPILQVIRYFETAPLGVLAVAESLIHEIVRRRLKGEIGLINKESPVDPLLSPDPHPAKRKRRQVNGGVQGELPPV